MAEPGQPERIDDHYERHGTANLFLACEPLRGWRAIKVTQRRTKLDWAHFVRELVDEHYPQATRVILVMDNLNTHQPASLYEAFEPAEAKRIWDRLELHYTPVHGSWLNIAECEFSVLSRQCTNRRVPDQQAPCDCDRRLAAGAQPLHCAGEVAIHNCGRPHPTGPSIPKD